MKHILLILLALTFIGCRSLQSPKATTKSFFKAINQQDFDRAYEYVILDGLEFVEDVERASRREYFEIGLEDCDVAKTEEGTKCTWVTRIANKKGVIVLDVVDVDNKWYITDFRIERVTEH